MGPMKTFIDESINETLIHVEAAKRHPNHEMIYWLIAQGVDIFHRKAFQVEGKSARQVCIDWKGPTALYLEALEKEMTPIDLVEEERNKRRKKVADQRIGEGRRNKNNLCKGCIIS